MTSLSSITTSGLLLARRGVPVLLCAAALGGLGVVAVDYVSQTRVGSVEVVGNQRASEVAVRHLADVQVGDLLFMVDLEEVLESVVQHPWVRDASVRRVLPDRLVVDVEEHRPALLLAWDGLYRVSDRGVVFERARTTDVDQPVLTGIPLEWARQNPGVARDVVRAAVGLLRAWTDAGVTLESAVSEVHFDPLLGFAVVLRSGARVELGYREPQVTLERLQAMIRAGVSLDLPVIVDLDLDDRAVVFPRPSPPPPPGPALPS